MKFLKIAMVLVFVFYFKISNAQQDAQFSQYIFNGLYINPAYAGEKQDVFVNSFFRSQWTGIPGAPQTISVAVDGSLSDLNTGLGVLLNQDKIGAQSTTSMYGNYSYKIQLDEQYDSNISFGLGFGFLQSSLNGNELNATQTNDNYIPSGNVSVILPDARLGILYTSDHFFAGASADNLLASRVHTSAESSLTTIPETHLYFTVGGLFELQDDIKFKPSILMRDSPGSPKSVDINSFLLFNDKFWVGATYRTTINSSNNGSNINLNSSNAVVGMVEFFLNPRFRVGYAFDYSLNAIGNSGYGSHELSVSFLLKKNKSSGEPKTFYF
ncbi:PorP/SprF family type IX secretion system membrane protein [Mucilaginibacter sp.]